MFAAVTGLALAAMASQASAACQFAKLVEVPVTMNGLRPTVAAAVNGHETSFLIDTGAFFSIVAKDAAARFEMRKSIAPYGLQIGGLGGASRNAEAVTADSFSFAGAGFKNIEFLAGGRVSEGATSGVIGQNIMGPFDVEYDFANGVMRFFKPTGCENANLAYWSAGMALSRISLDSPGKYMQEIIAKAEIDGRLVKVMFDSGAPVSFLSRHAAARVGVEVGNAAVTSAGISYGIYGKGVETFLAPFASFKIGDEEIKNTRLRLADIDMGERGDMLVGADFFLSHRILVSNSQKKLYFTYNGGPVFRLDREAGAAQQAQAGPGSDPAAATAPAVAAKVAAPGAQATASELVRRAAASAARRDFAAAIADLSRAIELEPNNAEAYRARATARLSNRQPVLAMSDFDEALKRQPNDVQALTVRGELYLQAKDNKRAAADFDAAQKLAPDNANLPAEIGLAYARAGQFDPALRQLDGWIAAHPRDENLNQALAGRCWTRALSGKDLEMALADCDRALRIDRNSVFMGYRAMVLYRMGRLDDALAQYSASLKLQPRSAAVLYGRGLAELKKGDKAAGEADIAAASAIAPALAQEYRRFGLAPDEPGAATKSGA